MPTFIDDEEFNEQFQRTLVAATRGSADLGEALAIATRITPSDTGSWSREWVAAADRAVAQADQSHDADDLVSARKGYLRASEYYRQAFFFARTDLDDPLLTSAYQAHVNTFRTALPLLPHPHTIMDVTTNGVVVHGYLFTPDASGRPRPTVIAPAGYDSTAENGYILAAASALERDLNCLVFEGPGQGGVLYQTRLPLRHDFEAVLTPAIDWLIDQPGIDPSALVLLGRSFAGYLAARGAGGDRRLAALICDPAQHDFGAAIRSRLGETDWERLHDSDPTLEDDLAPLMADPMARNGFEWRMAAHGVTSLTAYLRELCRFSLADVAAQIDCPTLALAGEGDFAGTGQLATFAQAVTASAITHEFTIADGAGGHCEGLGQDLFDQYLYRWLNTHTHATNTVDLAS